MGFGLLGSNHRASLAFKKLGFGLLGTNYGSYKTDKAKNSYWKALAFIWCGCNQGIRWEDETPERVRENSWDSRTWRKDKKGAGRDNRTSPSWTPARDCPLAISIYWARIASTACRETPITTGIIARGTSAYYEVALVGCGAQSSWIRLRSLPDLSNATFCARQHSIRYGCLLRRLPPIVHQAMA